MSIGFRFRAYPGPVVAVTLLRWIGCQRFIYNAKVREDRYFRSVQRKTLSFAGQYPEVDQAYSHLIGDGNGCDEANSAWLREVPSHVLRNGATKFKQAYQRFFQKLGGRPAIQKRHGAQSVWLTSELFSFECVPRSDVGRGTKGRKSHWVLRLGTRKFPCGELPFVVSLREGERFVPPKSIHISVNAGRWHVSFSNESDVVAPDAKDTLAYLQQYTRDELAAQTVGLDLGVAVPVMAARAAGGEGIGLALKPIQIERLARKEVQRKRWQRRAARRVKGSSNRRKALMRAAKSQLYGADVRQDFAHQVSRALVDSDAKLFVFEALKIKNMTGSAKGTAEAPGRQVRQKAGLNRSILGSAWGDIRLFTKYKAAATGKLAIEVPHHFSSQECSACGHTHPDNRPSQAEFVCQCCEHAENADVNAARVTAKRGLDAIVSESYALKARKKLGSLRPKSTEPEAPSRGSDGSEPQQQILLQAAMPVEAIVSRRGRKPSVQMPAKQETPTTAAQHA